MQETEIVKEMENTDIETTADLSGEGSENTAVSENKKARNRKEAVEIGGGFDFFLGSGSSDAPLLDEKEEGDIDRYKKLLESGAVRSMSFTSADRYGNLIGFDGNITIRMLNANISGRRLRIDRSNRYDFISKSYEVKVTSVDEEKNTVNVSHAATKTEPRKKAMKAIDDALIGGNWVKVKGQIVDVFDRVIAGEMRQIVYLDIYGLGITGTVTIKEWANCYTPSLSKEAVVGSIIDVVITSKQVIVRQDGKRVHLSVSDDESAYKGRRNIIYNCSRRKFHELIDYDPWKLALEKLHEGMDIRFRIVSTDSQKRRFFASIDGIPNFNALGFYPDDETYMPVNAEYFGYVKKIKEDTKYMTVKPIRRIDDKTADWKNIDKGLAGNG